MYPFSEDNTLKTFDILLLCIFYGIILQKYETMFYIFVRFSYVLKEYAIIYFR